jgi:hypothetical protein
MQEFAKKQSGAGILPALVGPRDERQRLRRTRIHFAFTESAVVPQT